MSEIETEAGQEEGRFASAAQEEASDPNIEAEARKYGWRSKDEYTLNPERWKPAQDFLDSPQTQVKRLRDELGERDRRMAAIERSTQMAIRSVQEQERHRFDAEIASIAAQKRAAVESADREAYDSADERERELRKQAPAPQPVHQGPHPDVAAYAERPEGAWVKDPMLRDFGARAINADPYAASLPAMEQVQWAERKVREYFPQKFAAPAQTQQHSRVDGGGLGGAKRGKTMADMPAEVRQAYEWTTKTMGVKISEADYIKGYEAG